MHLGHTLATLAIAPLCAAIVFAAQPPATEYDVRAYGATGTGKTLDSPAINRAIEAAASHGGGTVRIPAGTYLAGSIHLRSHIALLIDAGAVIEATADASAYDAAEPNEFSRYQDFGHSHFHNSLIWGENLEDIAILGTGRIDGKGLSREEVHTGGNKAIALKLCRNVIVRDVSILMAGHFGILATGVDNLTISGLKIDTNRDGINIDSCRNVRISDCTVNSPWDDAIVLKSGHALGYARAVENLTITNCQVGGYDKGTLLGGTFERNDPQAPDGKGVTGRIKLGTESEGGFKNIAISNIVFIRSRGLALESVDGGLLEDVVVSNIVMRDIVSSPIFIRLGARMRAPEGTPVGNIRRVTIGNVSVYNAGSRYAAIVTGIPGHAVEDVRFHDIRLYYAGGGTREEAAARLPEVEKGYPDPDMFGVTPAYGFFVRHARGIEFDNVEIRTMTPDLRPAVYLEDVQGAWFHNTNAAVPRQAGGGGTLPTFVLEGVEDFVLQHSRTLPDTRVDKVQHREL